MKRPLAWTHAALEKGKRHESNLEAACGAHGTVDLNRFPRGDGEGVRLWGIAQNGGGSGEGPGLCAPGTPSGFPEGP